ESAVAFKGVRHVIRSLIGIVPTLMICYPLASKQNMNIPLLILGIGISILAYFIYELIATKNAKKLLYAIPFYLIVVVFDLAFIFGSQAIGNSIINDVPVQSDIQSVSVICIDQNYNDYIKVYQKCKAKTIDYENKELIKILSDAFNSNVATIKKGSQIDTNFHSVYRVDFHCKDGKNISRKVYIPIDDNTDNSEETLYNKIYRLMKSDENFRKAGTVFPEDNEVKKVYITDDVGAVYSSQFTNEEIQKVWQTFRNEYVSMSYENKVKACGYDTKYISYFRIYVQGYTGVDAFYNEYNISQNLTPRTYKIVIEILSKYQKPISSDVADIILSGINENHYFDISVEKVNNMDGNSMSYIPEMVTTLNKKDFENFAKAVKILTDAAQKDCDMSKDNVYLVRFNVDVEEMPVQRFEDVNGGSYSSSDFECFVNLTDEEYNKYCSIYDDFTEKNQDPSLYSE
ncbi:MAG: hypothetical protein PUG48_07780, partial [Clostridia bacterium]|nr:hypothetical protein [Clostridia bacterium]